jgi:hypothetical protein
MGQGDYHSAGAGTLKVKKRKGQPQESRSPRCPISVGSRVSPDKRRAKYPPNAFHQSLPRPFYHEGWV